MEKGSSLIEALLIMGLFLWFIVMVNQTISRYWSIYHQMRVSGNERVQEVNRFEKDDLFLGK